MWEDPYWSKKGSTICKRAARSSFDHLNWKEVIQREQAWTCVWQLVMMSELIKVLLSTWIIQKPEHPYPTESCIFFLQFFQGQFTCKRIVGLYMNHFCLQQLEVQTVKWTWPFSSPVWQNANRLLLKIIVKSILKLIVTMKREKCSCPSDISQL